jgi:putative nucleotidyltransferase with HDIG domain
VHLLCVEAPLTRAVSFRHSVHLVHRFCSSLVARAPDASAVARVRTILTDAEFACWRAMPRADRAESVATLRSLPPAAAADDRWAAAALLHDVGKAASGLGTFGRAVATARGAVFGADRIGGRAGRYLRHAEIGAVLLHDAGARAEVVEWASAHHDPTRWPIDHIPADVCAALARADGEALDS